MCLHFAPAVVGQCREEDAEEVLEKEKANFCDWFIVTAGAFDADLHAQSVKAQSALDALFADGDEQPGQVPECRAAEDLFK